MAHQKNIRYMLHETTRKQCSVGAAAVAGGGLEGAGLAAHADSPSLERHAAKRRTLDERLPPQRANRLEGHLFARPPSEVVSTTQAGVGELPVARGHRLRVLHRLVELSSHGRSDLAPLGSGLSCRCDTAADGRARFFPLRSRRFGPRNATSRPVAGGLNGTGPGSRDGRSEPAHTWFSSTKRASCSIRWSAEHGDCEARRPPWPPALGIDAASRLSEAYPSLRAADDWDGIFNSTWTAAFGRNKSLSSSAICWATFKDKSSWYGTGWGPTKGGNGERGCADAGAFTWSSCRPTRPNSIPMRMAGRISSAAPWPTTAPTTSSSCEEPSWSPRPMLPVNHRCFAASFAAPDCLLCSNEIIRHSFHRSQ